MFYENIDIPTHHKIPYKVFIHNLKIVPYHWHDFLEIILVLDGSIELNVENEIVELHKDEIYIVNSFYRHSAKAISEKNIVYTLQIKETLLKSEIKDLDTMVFSVLENTNSNDLFLLKKYLSKLALLDIKKNDNIDLLRKITILEILNILKQRFSINNKDKKVLSSQGKTLDFILYINDNISKCFSLNDIAKEFNMSPAYLSKLFKKETGINIMTYVTIYRLQLACSDLVLTNKKISDIAFERGFNSISTFNERFKKYFEISPKDFRKNNKQDVLLEKNVVSSALFNYINLISTNPFNQLFEYDKENIIEIPQNIPASDCKMITVNTDEENGQYPSNLTKMIGIGRASDFLNVNIQDQLIAAKSEVGFNRVRFHGIFSDNLMVFSLKDGNPQLNFRYINLIFDFFVSNDIIPFIEIGFMPKDLASGSESIYHWNANTSAPKNLEHWTYLVESFVKHLVNRYGKKKVETWDFEIWNEPHLDGYYWHKSQEEYLEFFKATYISIKNVNLNLKVSGFSGTSWSVLDTNWTKNAFDFLEKNNIILDNFTYHLYPIQWNIDETYFEHWNADRKGRYCYAESSYILKSVEKIHETVRNSKCIKKSNCIITEWNSSSDPRDLLHDTAFMGSFIVKNVIDCIGYVDVMSYWTLSDIFDEHILSSDTFHGGFGLITVEGIKKPAYYAFKFLNDLESIILYKDENMIITKDNHENFQILIHNFQEYDQLYKSFNTSHINFKNRYSVFTNEKSKFFKIVLNNIFGKYSIVRERVNRNFGSAFDNWINSGGENLTLEYEKYLKNISIPKMDFGERTIQGELTLTVDLEVHEITILKLTPIL